RPKARELCGVVRYSWTILALKSGLYLVIKSASQSLELLSNNYEALQIDQPGGIYELSWASWIRTSA
ncbi:hypothetical protein, partial [Limosilactobacillus oris]|uniref:hypothetical protein n=1 Tax=Limosilactobacillus oris TaxID=1632 RepID=UPI003AB2FF71